jgi:hypothetical protein
MALPYLLRVFKRTRTGGRSSRLEVVGQARRARGRALPPANPSRSPDPVTPPNALTASPGLPGRGHNSLARHEQPPPPAPSFDPTGRSQASPASSMLSPPGVGASAGRHGAILKYHGEGLLFPQGREPRSLGYSRGSSIYPLWVVRRPSPGYRSAILLGSRWPGQFFLSAHSEPMF